MHFTIAEKLISDNQDSFNEHLLLMIDQHPAINANKLPVLKWCVYNIAATGQIANLNWLTKTNLSVAGQAELILLLGQLLRKQKRDGRDQNIFASQFSESDTGSLFNYITRAEFMDKDYELSLLALLNFKLSEGQRLTVNIYLALIAIVNLDILKLEKYILDLKTISPASYKCMPVNPLNCLDAIYFYL